MIKLPHLGNRWLGKKKSNLLIIKDNYTKHCHNIVHGMGREGCGLFCPNIDILDSGFEMLPYPQDISKSFYTLCMETIAIGLLNGDINDWVSLLFKEIFASKILWGPNNALCIINHRYVLLTVLTYIIFLMISC